MVQEVDLYTVTIAELDFKQSFDMVMRRDDYVHALVCFFTVEFSKLAINRVNQSIFPQDAQADRLLDGPRGPLHALEADRLLPAGAVDGQQGRARQGRLHHEGQRAQRGTVTLQ